MRPLTGKAVLLRCLAMSLIVGTLCSRGDVIFDLTFIGDAGNPPDYDHPIGPPYATYYRGAVDYDYYIGTYEVTVAQYTAFLNAVAADNYYGLWSESMETCPLGPSILQIGTSGSYTYTAVAGKENQPVRWVSLYDAMRFCNWLHNGQGDGDTETGSYDLSLGVFTPRSAGATWVIPSQDEWYKAAYYDPANGTYYNYPNGSDAEPSEPTDQTTPREMNFGDLPYWAPAEEWVYFTQSGETTGHSPYKVYDMGGNVAEWTDTMDAHPYNYYRFMRGGHFGSREENLRSSNSSVYQPHTEGAIFGFRVAYMIPEPSAVVLILIGTGVILSRRRSRGKHGGIAK